MSTTQDSLGKKQYGALSSLTEGTNNLYAQRIFDIGGATATAGTVMISGTTGLLIKAANVNRKSLEIMNTCGSNLYIANGSTAGTTNGFPVINNTLYSVKFTGNLYGWIAAGSGTINYLEVV